MTLLATACLAVATVLAVPLFLALVAWSTATSLVGALVCTSLLLQSHGANN